MRLDPNDPHRGQPIHQRRAGAWFRRGCRYSRSRPGASAEDILGLAEEFDMLELAYLAPDAAEHMWYPYSFMAPLEQNQPWLDSALGLLAKTIERATDAGITKGRVVFADSLKDHA